MSLAVAEQSYRDLGEGMKEARFEFELRNDFTILERLVELVQQIVGMMATCDPAEQVRFAMAIEEALIFAAFQGNLEFTAEEGQFARFSSS